MEVFLFELNEREGDMERKSEQERERGREGAFSGELFLLFSFTTCLVGESERQQEKKGGFKT